MKKIAGNQMDIRFSSTDAPAALLGESPVVDEISDLVWWVDTAGKRLFATCLSTGATEHWTMPEEPGFVVLGSAGMPVVGMQSGIFAFDPARVSLAKLLDQPDAAMRFNDATVDASGRLWVSTIARDLKKGMAGIFQVTADLGLSPFVTGLSIPNGMAVDCASETLYFSDSHWDIQQIWTLRIGPQSGRHEDRQPFASTLDRLGRPDGAVLDTKGRYWIAAVDGAAIYVYGSAGSNRRGDILFEIPAPFQAPTKLAFYGNQSDRIALTSKRDDGMGGRLALISFQPGLVEGQKQSQWQMVR